MEVMNLRAYLANFGLSVSDMAWMTGCCRGHMSKIVSGEIRPGPRLAKKISEVTKGEINLTPGPGPGYNREKREMNRKRRIESFLNRSEKDLHTNIKIS